MSDQETGDSGSEQSKKPYTKPRLIEYGSVQKLTHSGTKNHGDGGAHDDVVPVTGVG